MTPISNDSIDNNSSSSPQAWPDFRFVDFTSRGEQWQRWRRIPIERVPKYAKISSNIDAFTTIQRFSNAQPQDGEAHLCPLYFDLDSDLSKGDLSLVLEEARKLVEYLNTELELPKEAVHIWFSGRRGFSITAAERAFGFTPRPDLTYILKLWASYIKAYLELTTLDIGVYSSRRMWRLPDSKHSKSGLFKVEIDPGELMRGVEYILNLAKTPRGTLYQGEDLEIDLCPIAAEEYNRWVAEYEAMQVHTRTEKTPFLGRIPGVPVCVKFILEQSIQKAGDANQALLQLACFLKDAGRTEEQMIQELTLWVLAIPNGFTSKNERERVANLKSVARAVYDASGKEYRFSCGGILSLQGEAPIPCQGELCPLKSGVEPPPHLDRYSVKSVSLDGIVANADDLAYSITGLEDGAALSGYVTLLKDGIPTHKDHVTFASHRSRVSFANRVAQTDAEEHEQILRHLMDFDDILKLLRRPGSSLTQKPQIIELTEAEKAEALELLKSPTLLYDMLKVVRQMGIVGEQKNAGIHILTFNSSILNEPVSSVVKGESAAGKSIVLAEVMLLVPPERYRDLTDATAQSFFYSKPEDFDHKILVFFERRGTEKADYSIRVLQSEHKLKIRVTIKDKETGKFKVEEVELAAHVGFISTTTEAIISAENETRNFSLFPDETTEQTERVLLEQAQHYLGNSQKPSAAELRKWHNAQRLLKPYSVIIPFAEGIVQTFPKEFVRVRRDFKRFLALVEVSAILHQYQRQTVERHGNVYLWASIADYHVASILLANEALARTIFEISPKSEELLEAAKSLGKKPNESFTIAELARARGWDYKVTYKWLGPLENKGYFELVSARRGNSPARYKLTGREISREKILPETAELYEAYPDSWHDEPIYDPVTGDQLIFEKEP